jgi:hypothetical protein
MTSEEKVLANPISNVASYQLMANRRTYINENNRNVAYVSSCRGINAAEISWPSAGLRLTAGAHQLSLWRGGPDNGSRLFVLKTQ